MGKAWCAEVLLDGVARCFGSGVVGFGFCVGWKGCRNYVNVLETRGQSRFKGRRWIGMVCCSRTSVVEMGEPV